MKRIVWIEEECVRSEGRQESMSRARVYCNGGFKRTSVLCRTRVGRPLSSERARRNTETDDDGIRWLLMMFVLSFSLHMTLFNVIFFFC